MPDPLQVLPVELWQSVLLNLPLLWSQIHLCNEEDEMALVFTFLHLSKGSPLHVDIQTVLPITGSLELIAEHSSRVRTISIGPGVSNNITALHTEQWKRAASFTLASLLNGLLPSDIKHTSCLGNTFRDNGQWYYSVILMHFTMDTSAYQRNRIVHTDSSDKQRTFRLWEGYIGKCVTRYSEQLKMS
jgi:hypothetical protein